MFCCGSTWNCQQYKKQNKSTQQVDSHERSSILTYLLFGAQDMILDASISKLCTAYES